MIRKSSTVGLELTTKGIKKTIISEVSDYILPKGKIEFNIYDDDLKKVISEDILNDPNVKKFQDDGERIEGSTYMDTIARINIYTDEMKFITGIEGIISGDEVIITIMDNDRLSSTYN